MKILIDMQGAQLEKEPRGIARYMICMLKEILKNPRGHEIILLFNGGFEESIERIKNYLSEALKDSQVVVWQPAFPQDKGYLKTPFRVMVDDAIHEASVALVSPDLYFSMSCLVSPYTGFHIKTGQFSRAYPIVFTLHDLIPLAFSTLYLDPHPQAAEIFHNQTENFKTADGWLTISDYSADEGERLLGLDPQKIYNASEGVDPFFHHVVLTDEDKKTFKDKYSIEEGFLLYVGGFDPRKNIQALIEAYGQLEVKVQDKCQLVLAGGISPRIKKMLSACANEHGIASHRIIFTGFIDDQTLRSLYCLATAFVFPTLAEGFGLPALEAMSCGTAVICSGCTSLPEVVNNPEAYFDPKSTEPMAQKMYQVILDENFRNSLIQKGSEQVKKFSWADSAQRALIFLEQVKLAHPLPPVPHINFQNALIDFISKTDDKPSNQELLAIARALDKIPVH